MQPSSWLLFRVESAVLLGITKPSCTDSLAKWNVPSTKTQVNPGPVSYVVFKKNHHRMLASINRTRQEKMLKGDWHFLPCQQSRSYVFRMKVK